jgi:hypothetical protein
VNVAVDVGVAVLGGDGSEHSAAASNQRRDGGPLGLVRLQNGRLVACLWFGEDSSREWEGGACLAGGRSVWRATLTVLRGHTDWSVQSTRGACRGIDVVEYRTNWGGCRGVEVERRRTSRGDR